MNRINGLKVNQIGCSVFTMTRTGYSNHIHMFAYLRAIFDIYTIERLHFISMLPSLATTNNKPPKRRERNRGHKHFLVLVLHGPAKNVRAWPHAPIAHTNSNSSPTSKTICVWRRTGRERIFFRVVLFLFCKRLLLLIAGNKCSRVQSLLRCTRQMYAFCMGAQLCAKLKVCVRCCFMCLCRRHRTSVFVFIAHGHGRSSSSSNRRSYFVLIHRASG